MTWTAPEVERADEPFAGDERAMLEGFLDWNRATLLHMCAGLTAEQLVRRSVPPSTLSLAGLARHLTDVERNYFRRRWGGQDMPPVYGRPERPEAAFDDVSAETAAADLERLVAEQAAAREAVAHLLLDAVFDHPRFGRMELRWVFIHMNGEYSGHNGHAALLRECVDGRTGL